VTAAPRARFQLLWEAMLTLADPDGDHHPERDGHGNGRSDAGTDRDSHAPPDSTAHGDSTGTPKSWTRAMPTLTEPPTASPVALLRTPTTANGH
jgi:hypothetical protein